MASLEVLIFNPLGRQAGWPGKRWPPSVGNEIPADECGAADWAKAAQDSTHDVARLNSNKTVQPRADLPPNEPAQDAADEKADHIQKRRGREKLGIAQNRGDEAEREKPANGSNHAGNQRR